MKRPLAWDITVALSVVGTDCLRDSGYLRAKVAERGRDLFHAGDAHLAAT